MVVERAIPRIQDQLEEGVRVRDSRAGPHLHGEQQEKNKTRNTEE